MIEKWIVDKKFNQHLAQADGTNKVCLIAPSSAPPRSEPGRGIGCQICRKFKFQMMQIIQISPLFIITTSCAQHTSHLPQKLAGTGMLIQNITILSHITHTWLFPSSFLFVCPIPVLDAVKAVLMLKLLLLNLFGDGQQVIIFFEYQYLGINTLSHEHLMVKWVWPPLCLTWPKLTRVHHFCQYPPSQTEPCLPALTQGSCTERKSFYIKLYVCEWGCSPC